MDRIDARKLCRDALKALRVQAMHLRQELGFHGERSFGLWA